MNSGDLSERDLAVLDHVARFRFTFKEIIARLFFGGADPHTTLDRLRSDDLVSVRKGLKGNRSRYAVTPKGADVVGVPRSAGKVRGGDSDDTHLALIGFCFFKQRPRTRLHDKELVELFPEGKPSGRYHVLEHSAEERCIYRVYVPGPATPPTEVSRLTRGHVIEALQIPGMREWVTNKCYAFMILVDRPEREVDVNVRIEELRRTQVTKDERAARILVQRVPGLNDLPEALNGLS